MNEVGDKFLLHINKEIAIAAPVATAWAAMLEQIGPEMVMMDGTPMKMKLEAWPGGRYFRDLGNNAGHLWGHVQVIKPPALLEVWGPLMMSYAAVSHVQYRLKEQGRGTLLTLTHRAFGEISQDHRTGVNKGWEHILQQIRDRAQK
jgi:hypothetical protein